MEDGCCCYHNLCPLRGKPKRFYGSALQIGCHVPLGDAILKTLQACRDHCLNTCQFFTGFSMAYDVRPLKRKRVASPVSGGNPLHFYAHIPYVLNLASDSPSTRDKSTARLPVMLKELSGTNSSVVERTGSRGTFRHRGKTEFDDRCSRNPPCLSKTQMGTKLSRKFDELRRIAERWIEFSSLGFASIQLIFTLPGNRISPHPWSFQLSADADSSYRPSDLFP